MPPAPCSQEPARSRADGVASGDAAARSARGGAGHPPASAPGGDGGPQPSTAWTQRELADPHGRADKARRVRAMFAAIAPSYDLNNRLHALGIDQLWRRRAVRMSQVRGGEVVLDVACGTGDLALAFARAGAGRILGADFTPEMLTLAAAKSARGRWRHAWQRRHGNGAATAEAGGTGGAVGAGPCHWLAADAMALPLADASVDVVSIAFGIRNVADPARAIGEFARVLRPGGRLVILEFSLPRLAPLRWLYQAYFQHILPRTATMIAGDRSGAYRYLPRSVDTFLSQSDLCRHMAESGLESITCRRWTFGIVTCYRGLKPALRGATARRADGGVGMVV